MAAGENGYGFGNLEFQAINSQGPGPGPMTIYFEPETREGWNASRILGNDPYRTEHSQLPAIQNLQRAKRQNCGNNMQGHHAPVTGSTSAAQNVDLESTPGYGPGSSFPEFRSSLDHGSRRLSFHSGRLETGHISSGLGLNEGSSSRVNNWNVMMSGTEMENSQFPSSSGNLVGHSNPDPHSGTAGRMPCKRKSSMDNMSGPQSFRPFGGRDSEATRYVDGSGLSRSNVSSIRFPEATAAPLTTVWEESQYCRTSDGLQYRLLINSLHHPSNSNSNRYHGRNTFLPQEIRQPSSNASHRRMSSVAYPAQAWIPRGMPGNENIPEQDLSLHEQIPLNQSSTSSVIANGSSNFIPDSMNNSGFVSATPRDPHPVTYQGNSTRHRTNGAPYWVGVQPDGIAQTSYEPARVNPVIQSRPMPVRETAPRNGHLLPNHYAHPGSVTSRPSTYSGHSSRRNNFVSQASLMPFPPASCATANNMIQRPQPTFGDSYPSFPAVHGNAVPSYFPGSFESNRVSSQQNNHRLPLRAVQVLPTVDGANRRHFSSHDMLDQYNGIDIHDQHSNMRLDVDNMSYEELLALEERIGNVWTGLSKEAMEECLKISKYSSINVASTSSVSLESEVKCSICQEEYLDGDEMGKLGCGHSYHTHCIKQWLHLKNLCPICKATANSSS